MNDRNNNPLHNMTNSPILSVIIPYYNEVKFLMESVQSIINQEFKDFELLILDDGSKINAEELIDELNDTRIKYIRKPNVGLANNINRSLASLKGKYVARLDQDDISTSDRFLRQLEIFKDDPTIDCVFTGIKRFGSKKEWIQKKANLNQPFYKFEPFRDGCKVNSTMMIKKDVLIDLNGYRQEYYPSDDWDLELRMCQKYNIVVLEDQLVFYRFHESANTYKTFELMQDTRRWAEENYFLRENDQVEISLENHLKNKSFITKIRHYRKDKSKLHARLAGDNYLQKNMLSFYIQFIISFLYHPNTLLKRVLNRNKT